MPSRENAHQFLRKFGLEITLVATFIATLWYAFLLSYAGDANLLIGKFVSIVLNAVSAAASCVAFLAVVIAPTAKWGEMSELRTYIGIGSLVGLIASAVLLLQAFKAAA